MKIRSHIKWRRLLQDPPGVRKGNNGGRERKETTESGKETTEREKEIKGPEKTNINKQGRIMNVSVQ